MAHFEDDRHQTISRQQLPIRVHHIKTIYLMGGVVGGTPLRVESANPRAVTVTEVNQPPGSIYRRFTLRAIADADVVDVTVFGPDGHPWDVIRLTVANSAESPAVYRNRVMSIAASQLGSHYLWGAAGAMPGLPNGMRSKPGGVEMFSGTVGPNDVQHSVAKTFVHLLATCAGRPWSPQRHTPAYVERASDAATLGPETPQQSYRTVYFYRDYPRRIAIRRGVILGERCEGKRHFDCVGFISYCLSEAIGTGVHYEICGGARDHFRGFANSFPVVDPHEPHLPGDILIFGGGTIEWDGRQVFSNAHHIGFSTGDGTHMIHAMETEYGVVRTAIGGGMTRRVRHPMLA